MWRALHPTSDRVSASILIIDDDPAHLKLYSWIVQRAGYKPQTALVGHASVDLPKSATVDAVLLDYRLDSTLTAVDVAKLVKTTFPDAPVIVLSALDWMPDDIAPFAAAFAS
jgi:two-component system alkaline phosphatase synthesis response regulator PhoP